MARTTAPLLSFGASGQIGKTMVFGHWKGRGYSRKYVIPKNPKSTSQLQTRNVFKFLNAVWKRTNAGFRAGWQLYGANLQITDRNAFMKQNVGPLRTASDLTNFVFSPSAGGGIQAASHTITPGAGSLTVAITAPTLPTGWSIVSAYAAAIRDGDPHTSINYATTEGEDASSPYSIVLTGLTSSQVYRVGSWFKFTKDDQKPAFGQAITGTGTPT